MGKRHASQYANFGSLRYAEPICSVGYHICADAFDSVHSKEFLHIHEPILGDTFS